MTRVRVRATGPLTGSIGGVSFRGDGEWYSGPPTMLQRARFAVRLRVARARRYFRDLVAEARRGWRIASGRRG